MRRRRGRFGLRPRRRRGCWAWRGLLRYGLRRARRFRHGRRCRGRDLRWCGRCWGCGSRRRRRSRRRGRHFNRRALFRCRVENHVKTLFFDLQRALAWGARVEFQKHQACEQQMRQNRCQNRPPAQARPLGAEPAYRPTTAGVSGAGAGQFWFGAAHRGGERVLKKKAGLGTGPSCRMGTLCYINPARRVSTGVVQLICNQKVGGSNPSPGTNEISIS